MTTPIPTTRTRRPTTAKVAAQRLGLSVRTVQRYVSEERDTYEKRAKYRRFRANEMREAGSSWAEIAKEVGGSEWSARALVRRYKQELKATD
jgi:transposase